MEQPISSIDLQEDGGEWGTSCWIKLVLFLAIVGGVMAICPSGWHEDRRGIAGFLVGAFVVAYCEWAGLTGAAMAGLLVTTGLGAGVIGAVAYVVFGSKDFSALVFSVFWFLGGPGLIAYAGWYRYNTARYLVAPGQSLQSVLSEDETVDTAPNNGRGWLDDVLEERWPEDTEQEAAPKDIPVVDEWEHDPEPETDSYDDWDADVPEDVRAACRLLELPEDLSFDRQDLLTQRRNLLKQKRIHPDLGGDDAQARAINAAAEMIRTYRGWPR